jgi:hypothetical protein
VLRESLCPFCGEPVDANGDCTACDYYEHDDDALLFDDSDLAALHATIEGE